MEHNENNIKDMRGSQPPLPPELQWSSMKNGILEKMNSVEQAELTTGNNKASRRRMGLFLVFFFALAGTGSAGWFFYLLGEKTDSKTSSVNQSIASVPDENPPPATGEELYSTHNDSSAETVAEIEFSDNEQAPIRPIQKNTIQGQSVERLAEGNNLSPIVPSDSSTRSSRIRASEVVKSQLTEFTVPTIGKTESQTSILAELTPHYSNLSEEITLNHSVTDSLAANNIPLPALQNTRPLQQLTIEGGLSFWDEGYGDTNPEREQYEAPIPSFQIQGAYTRGLKGSYFLMVGLQYQQLDSKLEYSNIIEDYPVTLEDTILQVQQNLLTGKETVIRGDAVQTVRAERRVRHYNRTQLLRTSLAFGKAWQFNRFQTDVYLGSTFGAVIGNEGRMFSGDDILDYSGLSTPFYQNRWTVDGLLGARFHYFPFERVGITTGFQAQRSLMNWSSQDEIRFFPTSLGVQLGVSYSL